MAHVEMSHARFKELQSQGVYRMEASSEWHGEDWGQYQDDLDAAMYYGSLGLYDPTIPGEVGAWKARGFSSGAAFGITFGRAVLGFTAIMWVIDPADKREGGWAESDWYHEWGPPAWHRAIEWTFYGD